MLPRVTVESSVIEFDESVPHILGRIEQLRRADLMPYEGLDVGHGLREIGDESLAVIVTLEVVGLESQSGRGQRAEGPIPKGLPRAGWSGRRCR